MRGLLRSERLPRHPVVVITTVLAVLASGCTGEAGDGGSTSTIAPTTVTVPPTEPPAPPPRGSDPPVTTTTSSAPTTAPPIALDELAVEAFPVPAGSRPHDVAPAADGGVWYTAQNGAALGWLDPASGDTFHIPLGTGSRPHGVILDQDGDPWITDGGLNAIVAVDATTHEVTVFPLPGDRTDANLNTATFDAAGRLWFTGQNGIYGVLDPATGTMNVYDAPRGRGPYGIHTSPTGDVYYASLAGSYVGAVDPDGSVVELEPPTPRQGARRVWFDSAGRAWVSEWNSGQLSAFDPEAGQWSTFRLPGAAPQAYAVYVDADDIVWVTDFGGNAIHRFDPATETFLTLDLPHDPGDVRQLLGRSGEVWGAESAADHLVLIRTRS